MTMAAPTITIADNQTVTVGQSFSLQVQANDAEGDGLIISLSTTLAGSGR